MKTKTNGLIIMGAVLFLLWALFHMAIGVYHTLLFATQGSQSLFSAAYGIPVSAAEMRDPARLLGSDAIEVYSILLFGYGVLAIWATLLLLRGQRLGFWMNTILLLIAQLAVLYGLIIPGRLTGINAFADLVVYLLGVLMTGIGFRRLR
ncbi:MAG TPA: hypothetical protein VKT82_02235 [Ktedonobacterales bacterium]|nr:hypothetical protein [Ktedonobacterales bacterium]